MSYRRNMPWDKHGFYQSMNTHKKYNRLANRGFTMHRSNFHIKYNVRKRSKDYDFTYKGFYEFRMGGT